MIDFPASPTVGQTFTAAGVTWTWDNVKWTASGLSVAYLPLAGGTMTGPLALAADPTIPLGAATAEYADKVRYGDNRVINGDMRIDARNNGASGTVGGYTVDRWQFGYSIINKMTWGRNLNAVAGPVGFPYYLGVQSSSAYTPLAADYFQIVQAVEADMVSDFAWGTANAQPVTVSFWARSSLTGTFSGCICNYAGARVYPFTYSLPTANTWTKIVVTIPGDTAGTWVMSGNAGAMLVIFDLGAGSTWRGPAGAWINSTVNGVTGAVSVVATNGATFYVTGVKLEIGSVATPFNRQSLAKSMADCQRYYETGYWGWYGYTTSGANYYTFFGFRTWKRATPTMVYTDNGNTGFVAGAPTSNYSTNDFASCYKPANATASGGYNLTWTASAEL